jgi:hypothetical protein
MLGKFEDARLATTWPGFIPSEAIDFYHIYAYISAPWPLAGE